MQNETLEKIEYLREKANVTYDEAMRLLEENNGDVMRVLVALEKQGRVYSQPHDGNRQDRRADTYQDHAEEFRQKAESFIKKASKTRIIVEKGGEDGESQTVLNVGAPIAAGVTVIAPYVTAIAGALAYATGHKIKVETDEENKE